MKKKSFYILMLLSIGSASAQRAVVGSPQTLGSLPRTEIVYPVKVEGVCAPRADFFSYSTSPVAQRGALAEEFFYKPVTGFETTKTDSSTIYTASVELSARWMGRTTRIHTEGSRRYHRVWINGIYLGASTDSRLPSEFSVGTHLVEHTNVIKIEVLDVEDPVSTLPDNRPALTDVYLVSQPMAHIADYEVTGKIDSLGKGHLYVTITIENGYNLMRPIAAGCVLALPDGRTNGYLPIEKIIAEHATERIVFDVEVPKPVLWSTTSPTQYPILLYVRFNGQIVEYVPIKGTFLPEKRDVNESIATRFNALGNKAETAKQLTALKKQGTRLLKTDYPQPSWFYDACDELGIEVIECANIHALDVINNSPEFAAEFERRVETVYRRSRMHPCIVAYRVSSSEIGTNYALWRACLKLDKLSEVKVLPL